MDSPLPPNALPPRRRVEGSSTEHNQQLEKELTSALDLTPFQVANHGKASATEISRQNRKMQPHMRSQVDGLSYPEARLGRGMRLLPRAITLFTRVAGCSGRSGALSLHAAVRVTLMVLSRRSREMCI